MDEKEKVLSIVRKYLNESNEVLQSVEDFGKFEPSLPASIQQTWESQNDFFNDLAAFMFKK